MNKELLNKTTCLLLFMSLLAGFMPDTVNAASTDTMTFSKIDTITRVYDDSDSDMIQYHYIDENGKQTDVLESASTTTAKHPLLSKKDSDIPDSYDLRSVNAVTSVKDQGLTGCCWAFAAIKSLESNLILKGLSSANNTDLSESHLAWYSLHTSKQTSDALYNEGVSISNSDNSSAYQSGGSALLGIFALARWSGAVYESTAPFSGNTLTAISNMGNKMSTTDASLRYRRNYLLSDATCYDNASRDEIKKALMTNGAIDVSFYYNENYENVTGGKQVSYYQTRYTNEEAFDEANHSVTIIGWDDSYSKENFGTKNPPSSDGAWLIANSYGTSYGQDGYFWISYEEPSLTEFYSFQAAAASTYDNNYQYDAAGWGSAISSNDSTPLSAANIFTANSSYTQLLKAVGIYTVTDNQPYTIKIYRNVTAGKPTSGTLVSTITGTQAYQGYHTVSLPNAISLTAGEKFSVVITYDRKDKNTGYIPIEGANASYDSLNLTYTSNVGESFLYTYVENANGTSGNWGWYDIQKYGNQTVQNNVCIKAFTKNQSPAGSISLSKSSVTLGKGETFKTSATIKNVTNKKVTYKSNNTKIATVSSSGKITAKAVGKTTISATLTTGKSAKITVTVKKAPKKITLKPAKTKTIRRKKSFKIKVKLPSGSASNKITYTSSKPKVAKVTSSGKVTGKKKGTATITVKTFNKKKAKIKVRVK